MLAAVCARSSGGEPGEERWGDEVSLGQCCGLAPLEGDVVFEAVDLLGPVALGRFHVKQHVPLVARLVLLDEQVLAGVEELAGADFEAGFLEELAGEGLAGGLAGLDVPAGEVGEVVFAAAAEEEAAGAGGDASGDALDFFGVSSGHGLSLACGFGFGVL